MNDEIDQLLVLIRRQKSVYDELLALAGRKKAAIVTGNVSELDQVVQAEELLLLHVGELEKIRLETAWAVSPWADLDPERRRQAENLQQDFRHTLEAISRANEVNSRLLTIHLHYVQSVIDIVTHSRQEKSYEADGSLLLRRTQAANLIDEVM